MTEITKTYSALPTGYNAQLVTVESDITKGLNNFSIVGMGDKTIAESRDRIRSAIRNSDLYFPSGHITINLAPAELPKTGSYLDLPIATTILALTRQLKPKALKHTMFVGELALDGTLRPVKGIINIVECARKHHIEQIFLPTPNATQATIVAKNINIIPVSTLKETVEILYDLKKPSPIPSVVKNTETDTIVTLDQIIHQTQAKRAITVAVAGRHNILLTGPPGAGKSLLANAAGSLMPPPTDRQIVEITKIHSLIKDLTAPCTKRPFRAPHHSASRSSLLGGSNGLPGELSLAHQGILFLDELPEFTRDFLESLRQPLETKSITISRTTHRYTYPANIMLIAAMNPCPCGYNGSADHECSCSQTAINNYRRKLSGPLLDRIDMTVNVSRVPTSVLVKSTTTSTVEHQTAKKQIQIAMNNQFNRQNKTNADLSSSETIQYCKLSPAAKHLLEDATAKLSLSARAYFKTIKVARTIADLECSETISKNHLSEALQYRYTPPQ